MRRCRYAQARLAEDEKERVRLEDLLEAERHRLELLGGEDEPNEPGDFDL